MENSYSIGVPDVITKTYKLFHLLGLWKKDDRISAWQFFCFILIVLFTISVTLGGVLAENANETVYHVVAALCGVVQTYRMYYLIWKQKDYENFTFGPGQHSTNDFNVFTGAERKLKIFTMVAKLMYSILFFALVGVTLSPFSSKNPQIIFDMAFPIDYKNGQEGFWIAHAFIFSACCSIVIVCLSIPIVWYLMINLTIKYEILGGDLKNLGKGERVEGQLKRKITMAEQNQLYLEGLVGEINRHNEIYKTVEQFASTFSTLFLLQIVSSSICICGSVYALAFSNHESLFQDVVYCGSLFYLLVDSFMLTYLGNEIKLSSDQLSYCLFESNWMVQTKSCKKLLLIVVERFKRPHEIIVGKLFPLTLEFFTVIVRRAYSMFNILLNLRQ